MNLTRGVSNYTLACVTDYCSLGVGSEADYLKFVI